MSGELPDIRFVISMNGHFGIADTKHKTWLSLPVKSFKKKREHTEITIVVDNSELEEAKTMGDWLDKIRDEMGYTQ